MHEKWAQDQVRIAMPVDHPLKDEMHHFLSPGPGSYSPLFALLVKLRQLRIAIALLDQQVHGVGRFSQSLPVPGIEVAIYGRQLSEPTIRAEKDRCYLAQIIISSILVIERHNLGRGD